MNLHDSIIIDAHGFTDSVLGNFESAIEIPS